MLTVTLMLGVMGAVVLVQWLKVPGSGDSSHCGLFREDCPRINAITFSLKSRQPILTVATTSCDRSKASHVHFGVTGTAYQGTGPMIVVSQCQDPAAPSSLDTEVTFMLVFSMFVTMGFRCGVSSLPGQPL